MIPERRRELLGLIARADQLVADADDYLERSPRG